MENSHLPETVYENLPDFLKELTAPFEGRERDIVLLSSLGVLSACLPKIFGIYANNKVAPNLFILIVAGPANGKGVMNNSKMLIEKIHDNIMDNSLAEIENCQDLKKNAKKTNQKCPELEIKIIPGNISSSKLYKHIKNSKYGVLILESEADTISNMMKQDWGDFSDLMRKAFHHETISISRNTDDTFFEIRKPQLSLVISGTPNQVKPLLKSVENGLFSRFLIYQFDELSMWKDVSPNGAKADYDTLFNDAGDEIYDLYKKLENNETEVEIKLTNNQWDIFHTNMTYVTNLFNEENRFTEQAIIRRQGIMFFRICLILTILRHKNKNKIESGIFCEDQDFEIALTIIKSTIDHSIRVSNIIAIDEKGSKQRMTVRETMLFSRLNSQFKKSEALEIGIEIAIPPRTIGYILKKWTTDKFLNKISNGVYQKLI
jgi:Protein of unknown function (DUF3987)